MRIHLIKEKTIRNYVIENMGSKHSFDDWLTKIKDADWNKPDDIMKTIGSADLLGNGTSRIVFNIGGNNYRMICKYGFGHAKVHLFICWIGTHSEYDKLCDKNKQYTISNY